MLPENDDLIPIPPAAEGESAAEGAHAEAAAPEGVEIVELIADFGAAGASVDLAVLFEDEVPEEGAGAESAVPGPEAEPGADSPAGAGFAFTFPAGFASPEDGPADGGFL